MRLQRNHSCLRRLVVALLVGTASIAIALPGQAQPETSAVLTQLAPADTASYLRSIEVVLNVRSDRTAETITTTRIKILGEAALEGVGQQFRRFAESMETLDVLEAYTEKADGRRIDVDADSIITRDDTSGMQMIYLDTKKRTIIFPDLSVGDTVVLKTRVDRKSTIFAGHFYDSFYFWRDLPFGPSTVRIIAPKAIGLKVAAEGAGLETSKVEDDAAITYDIAYRPRPRVQSESGETSPTERDPRILVSTFESYEEIGLAYWREAATRTSVTPDIQALADDITKGLIDRRSQAEAISRWVKRNIRYVAVYFGAARVVPNPAATVLRRKYGDCKDHVTIMSALLAAKGIDSEHVLIHAGDVYRLPTSVAILRFNHVILHVPEFGVYDDPTVSNSAFGVLGSMSYDKPVVHVSAKGARMARTSAMRAEDHVMTNHTKVFVAADGTITGTTVESATGIFATASRRTAARIQHAGPTLSAERLLRSNNMPGSGRFQIKPPSDFVEPYLINSEFTLKDRVKVAPGAWVAVPFGLTTKVRPGEFLFGKRHDGRRHPFVCFAGRQIEEIDITFAPGLPMPRWIKGRLMESRWFTFSSDYSVAGRTFKIKREFVSLVPGQICAPEVEADIAGLLKKVHGSLRTQMNFPPAPEPTSSKPAAPRADPEVKPNGSTAPAQLPGQPPAPGRLSEDHGASVD